MNWLEEKKDDIYMQEWPYAQIPFYFPQIKTQAQIHKIACLEPHFFY